MSRIAIIGAGAWGTALALVAHRAGHAVTLHARHPDRVTSENPRLPGIALPSALTIAGGQPGQADAIVIAVPTQHLRATLEPGFTAPLLICCKGLEQNTGLLPLEIAAETLPKHPAAILTGPNFAREIAIGLPAASVIASHDPTIRRLFATLLATPTLRLYGNDDPLGAQLGGAAKNVIAIAAGAVIGAGLGENARAALVTRGLAEIARLVTALGGKPETIAGLSGMGDLVLTCTGPGSRNFAYGLALGQGTAPTLTEADPVVEGIPTAAALIRRAGTADLPLCRAVANLVAGAITMQQAIQTLMGRPLRDE